MAAALQAGLEDRLVDADALSVDVTAGRYPEGEGGEVDCAEPHTVFRARFEASGEPEGPTAPKSAYPQIRRVHVTDADLKRRREREVVEQTLRAVCEAWPECAGFSDAEAPPVGDRAFKGEAGGDQSEEGEAGAEPEGGSAFPDFGDPWAGDSGGTVPEGDPWAGGEPDTSAPEGGDGDDGDDA